MGISLQLNIECIHLLLHVVLSAYFFIYKLSFALQISYVFISRLDAVAWLTVIHMAVTKHKEMMW